MGMFLHAKNGSHVWNKLFKRHNVSQLTMGTFKDTNVRGVRNLPHCELSSAIFLYISKSEGAISQKYIYVLNLHIS